MITLRFLLLVTTFVSYSSGYFVCTNQPEYPDDTCLRPEEMFCGCDFDQGPFKFIKMKDALRPKWDNYIRMYGYTTATCMYPGEKAKLVAIHTPKIQAIANETIGCFTMATLFQLPSDSVNATSYTVRAYTYDHRREKMLFFSTIQDEGTLHMADHDFWKSDRYFQYRFWRADVWFRIIVEIEFPALPQKDDSYFPTCVAEFKYAPKRCLSQNNEN